MENLLEKIKQYDDVVIFGFGNVGRHIYDQLRSDNLDASLWFCDNNRYDRVCEGTQILKPEDAFKKYPDALFIVGSIIHFSPMLEQLRSMGIPEENIIAQWIQTNSRMIPRDFIINLPYHLTEHCNLRCAGCLHFSNVAKEQFADFDLFKKTFKRFIDVMGDSFRGGIEFFGGEPLLHPQIEDFLSTARTMLPNRAVVIITNGTLLEKMPDSFWKTCAENNVHIAISGYPVNLNDSLIKEKANGYGVGLSKSSRDNSAWSQYVFDLDGNQNIEQSFSNCENANERFIMKDRFLYPCSVTACIEHFNKAFDQNLELKNEDYLDLFTDITAKDVLNFISKPVPFCRYCERSKLKLGQTWRLSKFTIDEYLE